MIKDLKIGKYSFVVSVLLFFIIIAVNFIFGAREINLLDKEEIMTCSHGFFHQQDPICKKTFGFNIYSLYYSLLIFTFSSSLFLKILNYQKKLLLPVLLSPVFYITLIELFIIIFKIPVLYRHFMEGIPSLHYQAFLLFPATIPYSILFAICTGFMGDLLGKLIIRVIKTYG